MPYTLDTDSVINKMNVIAAIAKGWNKGIRFDNKIWDNAKSLEAMQLQELLFSLISGGNKKKNCSYSMQWRPIGLKRRWSYTF
jgi:hypothetical protein